MRVNTGDFVLLDYRNYDGEIVKGIYYIIYHESMVIKNSTSFLAVKVSSHVSGYQVPIAAKACPFLKHDSYINCSSIHRFQESEVIDILGRTNDYITRRVKTQLKSLFGEIDSQLKPKVPSPEEAEYVKLG